MQVSELKRTISVIYNNLILLEIITFQNNRLRDLDISKFKIHDSWLRNFVGREIPNVI